MDALHFHRNRMIKIYLLIFLITAIIAGDISDDSCFIQTLSRSLSILSSRFYGLCRNYPEILRNLREDIKNCSVNKIQLDELESFLQDYCAPGSILMKDSREAMHCVAQKGSVVQCRPTYEKAATVRDAIKELCHKRGEMQKCAIDSIGKACGEGASRVTERSMAALESIMKGYCAEIVGVSVDEVSSANAVVLWIVLPGVILTFLSWFSL